MRHSDINLTMARYTHTLRGQEAEAVRRLPDLSAPKNQTQEATGTDGQEVLTPQLTPQLTPTAFSERAGLSADGTATRACSKKVEGRKTKKDGDLGTERPRLSSHVIGGKELRLRGFEPLTFGS